MMQVPDILFVIGRYYLGYLNAPRENPLKPILGHPVEVILCTEVVTVAG